jgi:DNA-directed RNA polymerase specialized sigma24 family protein
VDYPRDTKVFSDTVDRAREEDANDDELAGLLAPREREVLLMHEVHGVGLSEVALALRIPLTETERLLANARRRLRAKGKVTREE